MKKIEKLIVFARGAIIIRSGLESFSPIGRKSKKNFTQFVEGVKDLELQQEEEKI